MIESRREKFTYAYYKEFICCLREAYSFITFQEGKKIAEAERPFVIMRHDIDMDLEAALRISLLEKDLGIDSTYFFMTRCPLYNVFSGAGVDQVRQILAAGHHLGLHFDHSLYGDISAGNINYYVAKECQLLEHFFEHPTEAVSFHRPGRWELNAIELETVPNSWERVFQDKFEYFADSRGNWVRGNPLESEAFSRRKNLQILVHPIWWSEAPRTPYECLVSLSQQIDQRFDQYLSKNCQVWKDGK